MSAATKKKQLQLQLTYSVGDWVFVFAGWTPRGRLLARIESATPIETIDGDVWLVRVYVTPKSTKKRGAWSKGSAHRRVERALSPNEIADLRKVGVIPPAGSTVLS